MQKKVLAIAVASALGAPAVAMAQTSTVQVFGTVYIEYGYVDQGPGASAAGYATSNAPAASSNAIVGQGAGGGGRKNVDILQSPGSELGFKGEEKLGGGLSVWFQCVSTMDIRSSGIQAICSRNSALGVKGGFGNVFVGGWDMPFKRTISPTNVGGNDTGLWGTAFLLTGGSTSTIDDAARATFKRRQANSINYDSPNFGGFQVMAAYSSGQAATSSTSTEINAKARVTSLGAQYSAGPLYIGVGYERHTEFGPSFRNVATSQFGAVTDPGGPLLWILNPGGAAFPAGTGFGNISTVALNTTGTAAGLTALAAPFTGAPGGGSGDTDDKGWHVGAAYTWGPVRFGGQYTRQKFEVGSTAAGGKANAEYPAWHVGVDWRIAGPHGLRAGYTTTRDAKGNTTVIGALPIPAGTGAGVAATAGGLGTGAVGGVVVNNTLFTGTYRPAPCYATFTTAAGAATAPVCNNTGADMFQIRYVYTFSKRTEFNFGYVRLDNDANAAYTLGGMSNSANGANHDAFALSLRHTF